MIKDPGDFTNSIVAEESLRFSNVKRKIAKSPNIIGCVDGTHIPTIKTRSCVLQKIRTYNVNEGSLWYETIKDLGHFTKSIVAEECLRFSNVNRKITKFPNIIGCVDGTHISISSPGDEQAELFRNRKGYFLINMQAV